MRAMEPLPFRIVAKASPGECLVEVGGADVTRLVRRTVLDHGVGQTVPTLYLEAAWPEGTVEGDALVVLLGAEGAPDPAAAVEALDAGIVEARALELLGVGLEGESTGQAFLRAIAEALRAGG